MAIWNFIYGYLQDYEMHIQYEMETQKTVIFMYIWLVKLISIVLKRQ